MDTLSPYGVSVRLNTYDLQLPMRPTITLVTATLILQEGVWWLDLDQIRSSKKNSGVKK